MEENEPLRYIEKIILEIVDRSWFGFHQWRVRRIKKFNIARFNTREVAHTFLNQYDGQPFVKAQKITVWYNNQKLHLCVRDLVYGKINRISNSTIEFIYRKAMFSEIRWPVVTIKRINRVRWANENDEHSTLKIIQSFQNEIPEIHIDGDYSSINVDETDGEIVPCKSCNNLNDDHDQSLSVKSTSENTTTSFCRECQVRRSVSGLQKLINGDDKSRPLGHVTDDENHFRTSIYIHVNPINNP